MKVFLKILAAVVSLTGAAVLLKFAADVMQSCSHSYIDISEE